MTEPLLRAVDVTRVLPEVVPVHLVRGASLDVMPGEFMTITGPSGSGKSSLLYLLGLLDRPTSGSIFIQGIDVTGYSDDALARLRLEKLGFVFQSHFLLQEFSALENVAMPMKKLGRLSEREIADRAQKILGDLGLAEHAHKLPQQLSGGQRQRVAVARSLANDPVLICADEPTGNLDSVSSETVQGIFRTLSRSGNRAVLAVTHDPAFAGMADRRIHIVDGKIVPTPSG